MKFKEIIIVSVTLLLMFLILGCSKKNSSPISLETNHNQIIMKNRIIEFALNKKLIPDIRYNGVTVVDNKEDNLPLNSFYINGSVIKNFKIVNNPKLKNITNIHGKGKRIEVTAMGSMGSVKNSMKKMKAVPRGFHFQSQGKIFTG
jgi:hypothetical protein